MTSGFGALQAALSLPPKAYPRIVDAARNSHRQVTSSWKQILAEAQARCQNVAEEGQSLPSQEATTLSQLLGVDGYFAVRRRKVSVAIQLEFDPPLPGEPHRPAALVAKILQDNPVLAELVTAVGVLQLREAEADQHEGSVSDHHHLPFFPGFSLTPVLIELTPGFTLLPQPLRVDPLCFDTLCFAVIPLTVQVALEQGAQMAVVASSVLEAVCQDIMHSPTQFAVWFCGKPFDLRSFLERSGPESQAAKEGWLTRATQLLPEFLKQHFPALSFLAAHAQLVVDNQQQQQQQQFFIICCWDALTAERGADVLKRGCFRPVCEKVEWKFLNV